MLFRSSFWLNTICVGSSYLRTSSLISGTKFIANCINYQNQNVLASGYYSVPFGSTGSHLGGATTSPTYLCQACASGYIPANDRGSCINLPSLTNCLLLKTGGTLCQTCAAGYLNTGGTCSIGTISNCVTYINTVEYTSSSLTCSACASGFYLAGDSLSCIAGTIPNCDTYGSGTPRPCTRCVLGYTLIHENTNGPNN